MNIDTLGVVKFAIFLGLNEPGLTILARLNSTGPPPAGLR
ncbi:MAG: hypothetical protein HNEKOMLI_00100 [Sodalis sp. Psp]|nr:hypothetical protein [Sodalis sp. Psp]MCR3756605.1 hypothetical protein [Sodalis sp. Ppy]